MIYLLLGSLFGWIWLLSIPLSIGLFFSALFWNVEWSWFFYSLIAGAVSKFLLRGFQDNYERVRLERWLIGSKGFTKQTASSLWYTAYGDGGSNGRERVRSVYKMTDEQLSLVSSNSNDPTRTH
jgi:hypothetical protein